MTVLTRNLIYELLEDYDFKSCPNCDGRGYIDKPKPNQRFIKPDTSPILTQAGIHRFECTLCGNFGGFFVKRREDE